MITRGTRRWTPTALVLAVVAALAATVFAAPADAATGPSVHGVVTAADGSGPVAGIQVCAAGSNGQTCAETASDGSYLIQLFKGKFSFYAQQSYLYGTWVQQEYQAGKSFTFNSTTSLTADFALVRGARISGIISPADGESKLTIASIRAFPVDAAGKVSNSNSYFSNLAPNGYFEVAKLPAGTYKLQIEPDGAWTHTNQWYPAASSAGTAEPITVGTGQAVGERNFKLTPTGSIKIQVLNPDGSLSDDSIDLYDSDGRQLQTDFEGYSSSQTFTGLQPGAYTILASPLTIPYSEWFGGASTFAKASMINVVAGETAERTMTFHYKTLKTTKRPTLKRDSNELTASKGTWSPAKPSTYRYDWYRDGKVFLQDSGDWYIFKKADIGHRISVCITGWRNGYAPGTSCSTSSAKVKKGWV